MAIRLHFQSLLFGVPSNDADQNGCWRREKDAQRPSLARGFYLVSLCSLCVPQIGNDVSFTIFSIIPSPATRVHHVRGPVSELLNLPSFPFIQSFVLCLCKALGFCCVSINPYLTSYPLFASADYNCILYIYALLIVRARAYAAGERRFHSLSTTNSQSPIQSAETKPKSQECDTNWALKRLRRMHAVTGSGIKPATQPALLP